MGKRITFDQVVKEFDERGYTLLETEYVNPNNKMRYICRIHVEEFSIDYRNFHYSGNGCPKCGIEKIVSANSHTIDFVRQKFNDRGYDLISNEYKNARTKLRYRCRIHDSEHEITFGNLSSGSGCPRCGAEARAKTKSLDYEYVKSEIDKMGHVLLSAEYVSNSSKLECLCREHNEKFSTSYSCIKSGVGCRKCSKDKTSGENNGNWNGGVTTENEKQRKTPEYYRWRYSVFNRDKSTCKCCGRKYGKLHAHHIESFSSNELLRTDLDNGTTLCIDCHNDFHAKYGRKNNTRSQFDEWLANTRKMRFMKKATC